MSNVSLLVIYKQISFAILVSIIMQFTPRIDGAIRLAARLHRNQTRKDELKTPYISHLVGVAFLLSEVTTDEDIIIAGLLHDSLEDVPNYTYEKLVVDCGERVASIVRHVTEPLDATKMDEEQLPWLERKEAYLRVLKDGGVESALVSAADKIHNTESFLRSVMEEGEEVLQRFHSSTRNRLWFHEQVLAIVQEKLPEDNALLRRLVTSTQAFREFTETV
jgi:(p)ppGpp synthase/HD superfamily hydrolase